MSRAEGQVESDSALALVKRQVICLFGCYECRKFIGCDVDS